MPKRLSSLLLLVLFLPLLARAESEHYADDEVLMSCVQLEELERRIGGGVVSAHRIGRAAAVEVFCVGIGGLAEEASALFNTSGQEPLSPEPNHTRSRFATVPDDPRIAASWHLQNDGFFDSAARAGADVSFVEAFALDDVGASEVIIAVIDSGVDYNHPDLAANIWVNPGEIPKNGIDDDGNGYIDDVHGFDFAGDDESVRTPDGDPMDVAPDIFSSEGHGSHVSGIAAAVAGNGVGLVGVAPRAKIMCLKASTSGEFLDAASIIEAVNYCIMMKQRGFNIVVINASFGGDTFSQFEFDAYEAAIQSGINVVAAAGNESANNDTTDSYPANYDLDGLISVGASDTDDSLSSFSNFGVTSVDLAAPGTLILSTILTTLTDTDEFLATDAQSFVAQGFLYSGYTDLIEGKLVDCGIGQPFEFPPEVAGNIALIERGTLFFFEKVNHAEAAGAIAVVIYNNVSEDESLISYTLTPGGGFLPAVMVSIDDAPALLNLADDSGTIRFSHLPNENSIYEYLSGTSMAAPMVAGAVGLVAAHYPTDTPAQRATRIFDGADVIPSLLGTINGGRRLNLQKILDSDGDGIGDWYELLHARSIADMAADSDRDHDGFSDYQEFVAGSSPVDLRSQPIMPMLISEAGGFRLDWQSVEGRYYTIEQSSDLSDGFAIRSQGLKATPPINSEVIEVDGERQFFRVSVSR